jgi:hypothetical protein
MQFMDKIVDDYLRLKMAEKAVSIRDMERVLATDRAVVRAHHKTLGMPLDFAEDDAEMINSGTVTIGDQVANPAREYVKTAVATGASGGVVHQAATVAANPANVSSGAVTAALASAIPAASTRFADLAKMAAIGAALLGGGGLAGAAPWILGALSQQPSRPNPSPSQPMPDIPPPHNYRLEAVP